MQKLNNTYLRKKRNQLIEQLKKTKSIMLRGSLIARYRKCGKLNCHCVKGKEHGPSYYLSVSMPGTRPIMIYVSTKYKLVVEEALINHQVIQQIIEKISNINRELIVRKTFF